VSGDVFKLEQMVINLIDNALKYTEKGGVTISLLADGAAAVLEVEDTGIGIAPEHLPRVFERFYVVDKSRSRNMGGTGLGLSIVKHIVQMHKGEIALDSRPGRGTKFTIRLPLASGEKLIKT
jgi:two-component system phosphate regulon sensor histidine kinase PhoR